MRQLTVKQKKHLDNLKYKPSHWDELELKDMEALEAINDTEILWQEVSRYLHDKRVKEIYS